MAEGVTVLAVVVTAIFLWIKLRIPFPYRFVSWTWRRFGRTVLVLIVLFWIGSVVGAMVRLALVGSGGK